jgi:Zn-dependent protease
MDVSTVKELTVAVPAILLAVTVHEYSHGYMADRLGDPTPRLAGRLTLNPIAHIDILGALAFILFKIGWAKPVPVNFNNLRNPERDMIWVAFAGPLSNIVIGAAMGVGIRISFGVSAGDLPIWAKFGLLFFIYGFIINIALAVLNLIPIPPLDGSRIIGGIMGWGYDYRMARAEMIGVVVLFLLLSLNLLGKLIWPVVGIFSSLITGHTIGELFIAFSILLR